MKRAWITGLLVICFGMSGAVAQDTEAREDQDSVDRDAKDSLTKALRKSSDYGGMKVEGAVAPVTSDDEEEGGRPRRGGGFGRGFGGRGGGSFEGMFTALINSNGDAKITVETENSKSEIYKIGDAIASVTYGRGTNARPLGNFPNEVAKVLDFAGLIKQLSDATSISSGRNERVGDASCMTFNCTIKPEEPEMDEDEELDFRSLMRGGSQMIREIRTKVWIDEETGVIRKISVEMERGLSDAMMERLRERMGGRGGRRRGGDDPDGERPRGRRRGGDDPDDGDQERPRGRRRRGGDDPDQERPRRGGGRRGGFGGMTSRATAYEIEILEYLDDVKIEVPEELEEYLED